MLEQLDITSAHSARITHATLDWAELVKQLNANLERDMYGQSLQEFSERMNKAEHVALDGHSTLPVIKSLSEQLLGDASEPGTD